MVREFKLINENGQEYSLMDIERYCLLTDPSGLGFSYTTEYEQLGNTFISNLRKLEQGQISGTVNFLSYDNYKNFVDFIERAESLKFAYKIPFKNSSKEYFKDVNIQSLTKTQIQTNGIISESITFDCLSLWYEQLTTVYTIEKIENEIQWDFVWDSRFADYTSRSIIANNDGHVNAAIKVEISGHVINPGIYVYHNGEIYAGLTILTTIEEGEKLLYSSKDQEIYIRKQNKDGSTENLFKEKYGIDINNRNIFDIPKGSSEIAITAENNIANAKLYIYKYYKVV